MQAGNNNNNTRPKELSVSSALKHAPISERGLNSSRSLSTGVGRIRLASEGIVMLESIRKKKETQEQLKTLENRIRRLKEEENLTLIKQKTQ